MDQSEIVTMKHLYQTTMLRKLLESDDEQSTTAGNFLKSFTLKACCFIIADAWNSVIKTTLSRAWHKILEKAEPVSTTEGPDCSINDFIRDFKCINAWKRNQLPR
jgi:DDE superfamily endonuclease